MQFLVFIAHFWYRHYSRVWSEFMPIGMVGLLLPFDRHIHTRPIRALVSRDFPDAMVYCAAGAWVPDISDDRIPIVAAHREILGPQP